MARLPGTIKLASTIEPRVGAPLDARERVFNKADLTAAASFPYFWVGMEVYCAEDSKKYRLVGEDPTTLSNWEEVGTGGDTDAIKVVHDLPNNPTVNETVYLIEDNKSSVMQYQNKYYYAYTNSDHDMILYTTTQDFDWDMKLYYEDENSGNIVPYDKEYGLDYLDENGQYFDCGVYIGDEHMVLRFTYDSSSDDVDASDWCDVSCGVRHYSLDVQQYYNEENVFDFLKTNNDDAFTLSIFNGYDWGTTTFYCAKGLYHPPGDDNLRFWVFNSGTLVCTYYERGGGVIEYNEYNVVIDNPVIYTDLFPDNPKENQVVIYTGNEYDDYALVTNLTPMSNPQELGLYEDNGGTYELSTDTEADVKRYAYYNGSFVTYVLKEQPEIGDMVYSIIGSDIQELGAITEYDPEQGIKFGTYDYFFGRYAGMDDNGKNYYKFVSYTKGLYEYVGGVWELMSGGETVDEEAREVAAGAMALAEQNSCESIPTSYVNSLFN